VSVGCYWRVGGRMYVDPAVVLATLVSAAMKFVCNITRCCHHWVYTMCSVTSASLQRCDILGEWTATAKISSCRWELRLNFCGYFNGVSLCVFLKSKFVRHWRFCSQELERTLRLLCLWFWTSLMSHIYEGVSKSFWTQRITKCTLTTINTSWEATQRVMATKLTTLTYKIAIQLRLVAESYTICSSGSRRPVRKLLDTLSYTVHIMVYTLLFLTCLNLHYETSAVILKMFTSIKYWKLKIMHNNCQMHPSFKDLAFLSRFSLSVSKRRT
jgi:hypothetical protein